MSKIYNLTGADEAVTFNIGDLTLSFNPSDEKSKAISKKAQELKDKAATISEDSDEWAIREEIKGLLDDFLATLFDDEAPNNIYDVVGQNTWSYLKVFLQIAEVIQHEQQEKLNDENFKKYLAE